MPDWQLRLAQIAQRNRQDIVNAKLSRREMTRLGLLTPAGLLVAKAGLSARGAQAAVNPVPGVTVPPSPRAEPWVQPMPIIPTKAPIDPTRMVEGPPDGTTVIDGGKRRVNHQFCSYDAETGRYGGRFPPQKFYEFTVREAAWKFHPSWGASRVWGYDGRYPGPRIVARYGEPILARFRNRLPSTKTHVGFGNPQIITHLHNGHSPTESDGHPLDYCNSANDPNTVNPKGFKDYHYLNVCAGFAARGDLSGDPNEALGTLWYHDHHVDFTAQNVYRGLVGVYTVYDALDTGNEETGLRLPSGEFDVPIVLGDFVFDRDYQPVFDLFNQAGVLGDRFTANGAIQPFFEVKPRRYRLRFVAQGPSRWWNLALYDGTKYLPMWQIAADGNLLPRAIQRTSLPLVTAERVDVIVDFAKMQGSRLYLVNRQEMKNGQRPDPKLLFPGTPLVQINKVGPAVPDRSVDPDAGPLPLRPLPDPDLAVVERRVAKARQRVFRFNRQNGAWAINGQLYDPETPVARIDQEAEEVWVIQNGGGDWAHPVHAHFEEVRILSRDGVPTAPDTPEFGRKDVVALGESEEVRLLVRMRDMKGRYVMHCHNSVHEDGAMMLRFDIV